MKKEVVKFLILLLVAIGAGPATASFWQWSMTPSANGNADPSISWSEGMPPSVVNDSARAMMARLAEQAADTSGALLTSGGPTAFTVTTHQGFPSPPQDGQVIGVTFNVNSGGSPTLAVDGGTAEPIVSVPGTPANLTAGVPTIMLYQAASTSWIVRSGSGGGIMLGGVIAYTGPTAPPNYVFANGQCISTTTYATYWALIGSPAPGSCAAGQFAVLDLRGYVLAGLDNMGGAGAAGRLTSAATGCGTAFTSVGATCANGQEASAITQAQLPLVSASFGGGTSFGSDFASTNTSGQTAPMYDGTASVGYPLFGLNAHATVTVTGSITFPGGASGGTYMGSGQARSLVQPTIGVNYIIRVL